MAEPPAVRPDDGGATPAAQPPAIVLVRPQLGENIGAAARAMLNFGLSDLRLVAPRDGWPNPAAGPAASGADVVLSGARLFDGIAEAVADCNFVYASTVRPRGLTKPVVAPRAAARDMRARPGRSAILFGPERSGLETDDLAGAQAIWTIPVNPAFGSLNLAQAVLVAAWEWAAAAGEPPAFIDNHDGPAPAAELEGLFAELDAALVARGYFRVASREASARRTVRNLLARPAMTANEVRTWRGILSALTKERRPRPR
jgi:tRNA/rRNA methyltransferase